MLTSALMGASFASVDDWHSPLGSPADHSISVIRDVGVRRMSGNGAREGAMVIATRSDTLALRPWRPGSAPSSDRGPLATISEVGPETGATAAGRTGRSATSALDRGLAARLMAGDPGALAEVYDDLGRLVFGVSRRVVRNDRMAEDVTQEVFAFLWEHPERYDPSRGTLRAWLGLLAHRRSVDRVRAETRPKQGRGQDRLAGQRGVRGRRAVRAGLDVQPRPPRHRYPPRRATRCARLGVLRGPQLP